MEKGGADLTARAKTARHGGVELLASYAAKAGGASTFSGAAGCTRFSGESETTSILTRRSRWPVEGPNSAMATSFAARPYDAHPAALKSLRQHDVVRSLQATLGCACRGYTANRC